MEDQDIIELYWQRNENALTETDRKYHGYCGAVARHILEDKRDIEECVNDTWLKTWNVIPPEHPLYFPGFLAKITRNLSLDRYRQNHRKKRSSSQVEQVMEELAECVASSVDIEADYQMKELGACVNDFLSTLEERERYIFLSRYFYARPSKTIAAETGMKTGAVDTALSRTRQKLRDFLKKEGWIDA